MCTVECICMLWCRPRWSLPGWLSLVSLKGAGQQNPTSLCVCHSDLSGQCYPGSTIPVLPLFVCSSQDVQQNLGNAAPELPMLLSEVWEGCDVCLLPRNCPWTWKVLGAHSSALTFQGNSHCAWILGNLKLPSGKQE